MATPTVADKTPAVLELPAGEYWWCACGLSQNQPFCDGSHAGTAFSPVPFSLGETKRVALCRCKASKNGHLCDGTHRTLP